MAIIYVDISVDTGVGDGSTPETYAGFWDVFVASDVSGQGGNYDINYISATPKEYRLRGSRDLSAYKYFNYYLISSSLVAWDVGLYGPWRMLFDGSDYNHGAWLQSLGNCENGIIATVPLLSGEDGMTLTSMTTVEPINTIFNNMILMTGYWFGIYPGSGNTLHLNGCSLITRDQASVNYGVDFKLNGSVTAQDTVFNSPYGLSTSLLPVGEFTTDHCALKFTGDFFGTHTNAQTDMVPTVWPAWDAPKEDWNLAVLLSAVTTPPQPGVPPYTGYATDLWGNARNSIGAGYMTFSSTTTIAPELLRRSHGPVITDGGPGGRTLSGNGHEMSDYHAPWWLQ